MLRGLKIERANQAWALDTTYISMARGFVYLTAVVDWASRKVLSHRVAITLEAVYAVEALEEAFARSGLPEIVNTDQGSQFTAGAFTEAVLGRGIRLSTDGKGSWRDNGFVERVWRSVKYEEVYLKAYESVSHAGRSIGEYIELYNRKRPHSSLADQTPDVRHTSRRCLRSNRQHDCLGHSNLNIENLSERARPPLALKKSGRSSATLAGSLSGSQKCGMTPYGYDVVFGACIPVTRAVVFVGEGKVRLNACPRRREIKLRRAVGRPSEP